MHYAVIPFFGLSLSAITTAIIAFGINSSAYVSQTVYSGISTVSKDQSEAAFVLGFTKIQTAWYIVLPQAIKAMLPALRSEIMTLIKDSSLASIIGVSELYKEARNIISVTYEVKTMYFLVACIYFIMTFSVLLLSRYIEYRLKKNV